MQNCASQNPGPVSGNHPLLDYVNALAAIDQRRGEQIAGKQLRRREEEEARANQESINRWPAFNPDIQAFDPFDPGQQAECRNNLCERAQNFEAIRDALEGGMCSYSQAVQLARNIGISNPHFGKAVPNRAYPFPSGPGRIDNTLAPDMTGHFQRTVMNEDQEEMLAGQRFRDMQARRGF